ncbi:MAG: ferredoxin [Candidatus Thiodiazotropha sp.]
MTVKRRYEMGAGGLCICPKCGEKIAHRHGIPCQEERCPGCGAKLLREGSHHYRLFKEKQAKKRQESSESSKKESS